MTGSTKTLRESGTGLGVNNKALLSQKFFAKLQKGVGSWSIKTSRFQRYEHFMATSKGKTGNMYLQGYNDTYDWLKVRVLFPSGNIGLRVIASNSPNFHRPHDNSSLWSLITISLFRTGATVFFSLLDGRSSTPQKAGHLTISLVNSGRVVLEIEIRLSSI